MKRSKSLFIVGVWLLLLTNFGCKKLLEVDSPIQSTTANAVYNSNSTAAAVLTGIYINMSNYGIFTGPSSISISAGLSADELVPVTSPADILSVFYRNELIKDDGGYWSSLYSYIFRVNAAIEGIGASSGLTAAAKSQLLGESKFLRAFYYFYLVNLYGDVPLLTSTDLKLNSSPSRMNKAQVYSQIIQDLKEAQDLLNDKYLADDVVSSTQERVRPNKGAATALLSRVYLYNQQWPLAEAEASKVIANSSIYQLESLNTVFLSSSKEAIWQLQPLGTFYKNTLDGLTFILAPNTIGLAGPDASNGRPVYLSAHMYNAFAVADKRKTNWVNSVIVSGTSYQYAFKYKEFSGDQPRTENLMVLRLAEQYLIRAEARAQQGKIAGSYSAAEDLNVIRFRAGLQNSNATTQTEILNEILDERKIELFTEFGHRWFDLKRTAKVNEVMNLVTPLKGGTWSAYKALYPIPVGDIQRNPNLKGHQNPGYPEQ